MKKTARTVRRGIYPFASGLAAVLHLTACTPATETATEPDYPPVLPGETLVEGRRVWIQYCKLCHEDGGEDDAPRLGHHDEWSKRIKKGIPVLTGHVIQGYGDMPARAGKKELTDESVNQAVRYMVEASK